MVEDMGGVFTGGHIANAQTWKETWSGKHKKADRVIIFVTPEYYKYFTAALGFEHGRIYEWATKIFGGDDQPVMPFFVDESVLEDNNTAALMEKLGADRQKLDGE